MKAFSSYWYAINETSMLLNKSFDGDSASFINMTSQICSMNLNQVDKTRKQKKNSKLFNLFNLKK